MPTDELTFQLLQNALNAAQLRQQVYANNVANVDTPGFKRSDVDFESLLQAALSSPSLAGANGDTSQSGSSEPNWDAALQVQPQVVVDNTTLVDNNGNNVDIDAEMAKLAENQLRYSALITDMKIRLNRLQTAINGG